MRYASGRAGDKDENLVAHSLKADGFDASEDGTGRGTPLVAATLTKNYATHHGRSAGKNGGVADGQLVPEVLAHGQGNAERVSDGSPSLTCNHEAPIGFIPQTAQPIRSNTRNNSDAGTEAAMHIHTVMAVRRLTPRECERLQGFPDDYTLVPFRGKPACDGPRYKALGNSMATTVIRWIGRRILMVQECVPVVTGN